MRLKCNYVCYKFLSLKARWWSKRRLEDSMKQIISDRDLAIANNSSIMQKVPIANVRLYYDSG